MHKVHAMRYTSPRDIYKSRTSTTRASARYAGYLIFDFGFQNLVLVMGSLSPAVELALSVIIPHLISAHHRLSQPNLPNRESELNCLLLSINMSMNK